MVWIRRFPIVVLGGLAAALFIVSCARREPARPPGPVPYGEAALARANESIERAFELLKDGAVDSAFARIDEAVKLAPGAILPAYALVCAQSLSGRTEDAMRSLERLARNGMDYPFMLEEDPDLDPLRTDPRFPKLIERVRTNFERGSAFLASGFPAYDAAADTFSSVESLKRWKDEQDGIRRANGMFWTVSQGHAAHVDVLARYLANMKKLKADDPSYDDGLERVRAAGRLSSMYSPGWGPVADLVLREAEAYARSSPAGPGLAETNYIAALALSLKYAGGDERRIEAFRRADGYIDNVGAGNEFSGAAYGLRLANDAKSPGADAAELGKKLAALVEKFPGDDRLHRVITTRLGPEAARLLWPLRLDVADIDGATASLEEYAGKVLLVDFWATWCSPCRRELPHIVAAYGKYRDKGLEIVSISLDYGDRVPVAALRDSVAAHGMNWRHVYDGSGWNTEIVKRWFVGSIPAPFLVGRDGSLAAWGDDLRGEKLSAAIEKAL